MKTEKRFKLEKEFAQKWIKALRSGKFKQGSGYLKDEINCYCCLGVACHIISPKARITKKFYIDSDSLSKNTNVSKQLFKKMPELLRGTDVENSFVYNVSEMNDAGMSFNEIADWIEENCEFI